MSSKPTLVNPFAYIPPKDDDPPRPVDKRSLAASRPRKKRDGPAGNTAPPVSAPAPIPAAPPINTAQPLRKVAPPKTAAPPNLVLPADTPHTRTANEIWDNIMPTLKPRDQVVLWRLYRLSAGYNSLTCHVSIGKLSLKTGVKPTQLRESLKELEERKLIKRLSVDLSNKNQNERGVHFEVYLPRLASPKTGGGSTSAAPSNSEPNKERLKEQINKSCARCTGTGFYYPDGFDKPVRRCDHKT